ncbi:putative copper-exporting P-type ATPase V [Clostridium ragsdalei P11]|uniref:Cd(2+)-exporting ATPase n=1 Tax=Clostridium ragsdalei P11 TaxID=1353534 RepID=A0A1A6AYE1_9CLOT|nr:cation-translocating P-type ATPase [Clostridium ragsdalei]OBR95099.1 putative copper-exporting P-type ATPase V [Clostridium ragsdalei P11]
MKKLAEKLEYLLGKGGTKKDIILLIISGIALIASIFNLIPLPFNMAWIAIILCGIPIIIEAVIGLVTAFDIRADVLVSIALIASVCIGQDFAAGEVAFIMQFGALLEDLTVSRARAGIEKLVHLTPHTARVLVDGKEEIVPSEKVKINDIIRVFPGETIPVDGIILSGQTSINQAVMTGESLPVDKTVGDNVSSGTANQFGAFEMKAVKVGEDSSIQRMIRLVQFADAGKAKIVGIADRWATWIVVIALTAAGLTWFISGEIIRAVTILVVFCPCSLVLATPTAIMAAIGNVTKHGFLVREGDALERLASVSKIAFDKTGTLTYGTPQVLEIKSISSDISADELYLYAAAAESLSEHPLGKAVVSCYKKKFSDSVSTAEHFRMIPGRGVEASVNEKEILAGNVELMKESDVSIASSVIVQSEDFLKQGCTVIYIAVDKVLTGFLSLSDTIRMESSKMIDSLSALGVQPVLLTGDHENASNTIANQLHIEEVHANCLPEDKLNWISAYQKKKQEVCMIGDGINDAPALKMANVGIAMGGVGSDIAVDAADIALVDDEVKELPHLLALSKRMMFTIKCNLTFSMTLNFIAITLAITGILNPVVGALVHNAGSVFVIINSALLLKWKKKEQLLGL